MSAMDHPTLLTRLIIAAEAAIQMRHGLTAEAIAELNSAICAEAIKPVDVERVIGDSVVMCARAVQLADRAMHAYAPHKARPFVQVVGVLLPEVRAAMELAMAQRARPTP